MHTKGTVVHLRRGGREDGASAVEFALVLPILVLLLLGIMQFGFIFATQQGLEAAAREGGRLAAIGRDVTRGDVIEAVHEAGVPFINNTDDILVDTGDACDPTVEDGDPDEIKISASIAGGNYGVELLRGFAIFNPDLSATAEFRCESPHNGY